MTLIFIRTVVIFSAVLLVLRLMGKRQIGEMQPFEFVITLLIAELACIPMSDSSIPLLYGLVSIATVYLLHQIICLLDEKCLTLRRIISGRPSVVVNRNGIDLAVLKQNRLEVSDLVESLRASGYADLFSVAYAVYESNGRFSVIPNPVAQNTASLPILLIGEGSLIYENLAKTGQTVAFLRDFLQKDGVKSQKDVVVLTVDGTGKAYLQTRNQPCRRITFPICEGYEW